jgi:hypothetical protein
VPSLHVEVEGAGDGEPVKEVKIVKLRNLLDILTAETNADDLLKQAAQGNLNATGETRKDAPTGSEAHSEDEIKLNGALIASASGNVSENER